MMIRDLTKTELAEVAGGISNQLEEIYPAIIPGYVLVGWSQQIIGYDTYEWVDEWADYPSLFTKVIHRDVHKDNFPIIDIQPLYAPLMF